ncbi:MAG: hypothetical protein EOP42_28080 [Sphingobacteriaceae bacterium]|nr:MAG: hypothetical protein EOP42_28080 [Sphingobacteriaceae bacterium]
MMKNKSYLILAGLMLSFAACKDPKKDEKALESEVMNLHEKVMTDGETAMQNKMKLDTLILKKDSIKTAFPNLDTSAENKNMRKLSSEIVQADDTMSDWMHNYNPDFSGKSHQQIMDYLDQQKQKVSAINNQYDAVIKTSNQYLLKFKKK